MPSRRLPIRPSSSITDEIIESILEARPVTPVLPMNSDFAAPLSSAVVSLSESIFSEPSFCTDTPMLASETPGAISSVTAEARRERRLSTVLSPFSAAPVWVVVLYDVWFLMVRMASL